MTVVVVGANGQLGRCLQDRLLSFNNSSPGALVERPLQGKEILALSSSDLDICDQASVKSYFEKVSPSVVINAAAYTAVDRAEEEQERAHSVNCEGVENLADACAQNGAALIHVSTDYVFSGEADTPYKPEDAKRC